MMKKTQLKANTTTALSEIRPDWLSAVGTRGNEEMTSSDLTIPRIEIVQSQGPQKLRSDPAYIPGAVDGALFNTVSRQLYGNALIFVPVYFRKEFLVWRKRLAGGGYFGSYPTLEAALAVVDERSDDFEVVDTHEQFGLVLPSSAGTAPDASLAEDMMISMAKTKAKVSRTLNSLIRLTGGDRWSKAYRLESVLESNDKGNYYNFRVHPLGFVTKDLHDRALRLYEVLTGGIFKIDEAHLDDNQ
jgi:hypothetical protein